MGYKTVGRFVYDSATAQIVAEGGNVVFDNATISNNCALSSPGAGVIRIKKPGLYNVFFNATPVATAAGAVEFAMRHNGAVVPGANGSVQLAAVGDVGNVAFMSPVTVECGAGDKLHDMVVNAIAQAKQAGKEPPEGMERVWDWEHERIIEDTAEVRNLLGMLNA